MTTLIKDTPRDYDLGDINEFPMTASSLIYEGAAVGLHTTGYARPLVAGDTFVGFAIEPVDNRLGAAGDLRIRVKSVGKVKLPIDAISLADVGKPVYASDDDTFTLTSEKNSLIGRVYRVEAVGTAIVTFNLN